MEPYQLLVSHPSPDGSVVICAIEPDTRVFAKFVDEASPRDISQLVPDLLLLGLAAQLEQEEAAAVGVEMVRVGSIFCDGPPPELLFASPAGQLARHVSFAEAAPYIEAGIASQITAGVAAELAQELAGEFSASDSEGEGARGGNPAATTASQEGS